MNLSPESKPGGEMQDVFESLDYVHGMAAPPEADLMHRRRELLKKLSTPVQPVRQEIAMPIPQARQLHHQGTMTFQMKPHS
jgi:hypothetical protein